LYELRTEIAQACTKIADEVGEPRRWPSRSVGKVAYRGRGCC